MKSVQVTFIVAVLTQIVFGVPLLHRVNRQIEDGGLNQPIGLEDAGNAIPAEQNELTNRENEDNPPNANDLPLPPVNPEVPVAPNNSPDNMAPSYEKPVMPEAEQRENTYENVENPQVDNKEIVANDGTEVLHGVDNSPYRKYDMAPGYERNPVTESPQLPVEAGAPGQYALPQNPASPQIPVEAGSPDQYAPPQNPVSPPQLPVEAGSPDQYAPPQNPVSPQLPVEAGSPDQYVPPQIPESPHLPVEAGSPDQYAPPQNPESPQVPVEGGSPDQYAPPQYPESPQLPVETGSPDQYAPPQYPESPQLPVETGSPDQYAPPQNQSPQLPVETGSPDQYALPQYPESPQLPVETGSPDQYAPLQNPESPQLPVEAGSPDQYAPPQNPEYPQLPVETGSPDQYAPPQNPESSQLLVETGSQNQYAPPQNPESPQLPVEAGSPDQYAPPQNPESPQLPVEAGSPDQYAPPQNPESPQLPVETGLSPNQYAPNAPPTGAPVVNTTEIVNVSTRTETPDYYGWPDSYNPPNNDLYPEENVDDWHDQYYSYDEDDSNSISFNNPEGWKQEGQDDQQPPEGSFDTFDWLSDSKDEEPFDPYESIDDESYENLLKQEIEEFGNIGSSSFYETKQESPSDRLQPQNVYTQWHELNSSQATINPQAANNILLYCIPAILFTLILYIGYTNYVRKPKIVGVPSGNNWRADYRDIEAKSKEIEPMLRKAHEVY